MYLKKIKAHGFKSFADKIEIDVDRGVTGIVGPNGSGKSNIVDAVKWVLGEQSVKALRADNQMADVIFSGSKTREGMKRATVSLVFDNSDHYLSTDFNEIEIKRVLYKTGENEYYLNNSKVRLKDLTDLFLDSGASKESFNIVYQGKIRDIINSKASERRVIFEEAAGVLKYKKRKEESMRKTEKTKDNLERINLLINELDCQVVPLKKQSEIALKYQKDNDELEQIEISLISTDITEINDKYQSLNEEKKALEEEISDLNCNNSNAETEIEKFSLERIKIDESISTLNQQLLVVGDEISYLNSQKQLTTERQKYAVDDQKLENNLLNLKEQELTINKNIKLLESEIDSLNKELGLKRNEVIKKNEENIKNKETLRHNNNLLINIKNKKLIIDNKIDILNNNIQNNLKLPFAVKSVLNNNRLNGIHNTIGNLIEYDNKYSIALETALGFAINFIICDDQTSAKDAINYLKSNRLGRVTFFPINVIKKRNIDSVILNKVKKIQGFIGTASSLIKTENKYLDIVENQLGTTLVVENIDVLNIVGKMVEYRYKIVSLDGEILHPGGSISGGTTTNISSQGDKNELVKLKNEVDTLAKQQLKLSDENNILEKKIVLLEDFIYKNNQDIIALNEKIVNKEKINSDNRQKIKSIIEEIDGTGDVKNKKLDSKLNEILEKYYQKVSEKELLDKKLDEEKKNKDLIVNKIEEIDHLNKESNSFYNSKLNRLKNIEIDLGRMDVKLDNLLITLNENYCLTYEKAKEDYLLELPIDIAREKVNSLKKSIKSYGDVNIGAIAEFERVNKRYTFLTSQRDDLVTSLNDLEKIITEMDEIMIARFKETFSKINIEFKLVFKKLFKGGTSELKLTDKDDLLNTGIEIVAQPPGKKLNSIHLMSGGEKTLTAIALLFAIINVKTVPFCILDEVEESLDDVNVDMFGNYLKTKKSDNQFIIITHKKRTMEYADTLYGITMQESGVSKLVSVKLDGIES